MRTSRRFVSVGLLVVAVLLVAACSPASASAPVAGAQRLVIKGLDTMRFEPAAPAVQAGRPVQVVFENEGQLVHDVTFGTGPASGEVKVVAAAKTTGLSRAFTFDRPGTYPFVCSQPGHEAAGMKGTLEVQ